MRLASLPQRRDGRLIVVSADLAWYADADHIVPTLQAALDEWDRFAPLLETLATELEHGVIPRRRFHEREACAPLPRSYRRTSADLQDRPGDDLMAGRAALAGACPASLVELCAVTGEVAQGASTKEAAEAIRLVGMVHDLGPDSAGAALSPVFATPDALAREGLVVTVEVNGQPSEKHDLAPQDFAQAVAALAAARRLGPGTLVGLGPIAGVPGLGAGDLVRIDLHDARGKCPLGAIERKVV